MRFISPVYRGVYLSEGDNGNQKCHEKAKNCLWANKSPTQSPGLRVISLSVSRFFFGCACNLKAGTNHRPKNNTGTNPSQVH